MRQQLLLNKRGRQSLICQAQEILDYRDLPFRLGEAGVLDEEGENVTTKQAMGHLKKAQRVARETRLKAKKRHSLFYQQCRKEDWDTQGSFDWLKEGRFQGQTEALLLAAQRLPGTTNASYCIKLVPSTADVVVQRKKHWATYYQHARPSNGLHIKNATIGLYIK